MQNKIVIITGAGFSAPANLPIQNSILNEMIKSYASSFLDFTGAKESVKFLVAYIEVGLYLLSEYTKINVSKFEKEYFYIKHQYSSREDILQAINYIKDKDKKKESNFIYESAFNKYVMNDDQYYANLFLLKESLREKLAKSQIKVSLEDVFTSFDKTLIMRENSSKYTYSELDHLRHYIMRLFVYYFSKSINQHNFKGKGYLNLVSFIQNNHDCISMITTNWDTLFEKYMKLYNIKFNYCFNSYYFIENQKRSNTCSNDKIDYLKIHGSINWFKCLKCGTLHSYDIEECGEFLFDDYKDEKCIKCRCKAQDEAIQLQPEIITPSMFKSINNQLYNNLWKNASYNLQSANKIIFIGYSLPIADYEFRYLLKHNISKKAKIDVVLYHSDNPKNNKTNIALYPESRYRELFSNNSCRFFYEGFEDYFEKENAILG